MARALIIRQAGNAHLQCEYLGLSCNRVKVRVRRTLNVFSGFKGRGVFVCVTERWYRLTRRIKVRVRVGVRVRRSLGVLGSGLGLGTHWNVVSVVVQYVEFRAFTWIGVWLGLGLGLGLGLVIGLGVGLGARLRLGSGIGLESGAGKGHVVTN